MVRNTVRPLNFGLRLVGMVALLGIFGGWIWFTRGAVSLALDYPIRRAGESAEYPTWGSVAFYWNCVYQSACLLGVSIWLWGAPALLAFWLPVGLFPKLPSLSYWLIGFAGTLLPVIWWICFEVFVIGQ